MPYFGKLKAFFRRLRDWFEYRPQDPSRRYYRSDGTPNGYD
jgi:hypothetical protein